MKKILRMLMSIFFIFSVMQVTALAVPSYIHVATSVNPSELAGAGTVTMTVKVSNADDSPYTLTNLVLIRDSINIGTVPDLAPGGSQTVQCNLNITADQLGKDIPIILSWTEDGGATQQASFNIKVAQKAAQEPQIEFTRTVSADSAAKGDTVQVNYQVKNVGSVDVQSIQIVDGDYSAASNSLSAGSTYTATNTHTMSGDYTSQPSLTYVYNGKTYTKSLDPKKVTVNVTNYTVKLEADQTTVDSGDSVDLTFTFKNTGNTVIPSIVVKNQDGTQVLKSTNIAVGASKTSVETITVDKTKQFQYTVEVTDSSNKKTTVTTNSLTVTVNTDYESAMSITAVPVESQVMQGDSIVFNITLENTLDSSLSDVSVTTDGGTEIKTIPAMASGKLTFSWSTTADQSASYVFNMKATLPDGTKKTISSQPVAISVGESAPTVTIAPSVSPTATAEASPSPTTTSGSGVSIASILKGFLIAIVILAVIVLTILIIVIFRGSRDKHDPDPPASSGGRREGRTAPPTQVNKQGNQSSSRNHADASATEQSIASSASPAPAVASIRPRVQQPIERQRRSNTSVRGSNEPVADNRYTASTVSQPSQASLYDHEEQDDMSTGQGGGFYTAPSSRPQQSNPGSFYDQYQDIRDTQETDSGLETDEQTQRSSQTQSAWTDRPRSFYNNGSTVRINRTAVNREDVKIYQPDANRDE